MTRLAEQDVQEADGDRARSYHGRPVLKEPEWTWEVPWYLFAGGLAGASSVLAVGAALTGDRALAHRMRLIAAASAAISPPLLIADLGRPTRFLNMLRVFKPTSVMSVGSWTLASYSSVAIANAALSHLGRLPRVRPALDVASGVLGIGMTSYTGALVADTSIPVWHEARRHLPPLFASSALASAGAAGVLASAVSPLPARRLALLGATSELAIDAAMHRHLGSLADVYGTGPAAGFQRVARAATIAGAATTAFARRSGVTRRLGAGLVMAGGVCLRWAVFKAGFQSARDPQAVIGPQRARLDARADR